MSGVDEGATAFGEVADKFVESYRMGRDPSIEDYANRYPQLADQIRELLPTLVMMEKVKSPKNEEAELNGGDSSMVGQKLGDYQILREIGRGGMGVVYEAEQISLGRHVALKVMPNHEPFRANLQVRFEREAKAAARLHHTNIVPVFGVGEENGLSYYVMQFINGLGLDEIFDQLKIVRNKTEADSKDTSVQREPHPQSEVEQAAHSLLTSDNNLAAHTGDAEQDSLTSRRPQAVGPELTGGLLSEQSELGKSNASSIHMPSSPHDSSSKADPYWRNIARIGMQVSDALQYAHEQGVTHRDIKPSNLLLDVRNTVWVTDFGLAKADDEANITRSGDILGTIRYMPPEAFEGQADARGDLYSLGITLYELATLRPAFSAVGRRELIKRVASGHPEPLRRLAGNIPRDLATIIEKSIERDLGSRYQSAGELYDDLRRFLNDEPIRARRTSLLERIGRWTRHNRALAASLAGVIALLLMVVIGSVTAAFYFFEQEAEQRRLFLQAKSLASRNDKLLGNLKGALDQSLASGKLADLRNQALRQSRLTRRNLYSANMLNALESIEGHRGYARTQVILDAWRPGPNDEDLRGWEWYYIQSVCNQQLFTLAGHEDRVLGVSLSPTANRLASASRDGTLIIWDLDRQTSITRLTSPVGALRCVAWDPQDRYVAVGGERGMVVWDVSTWEIVHQSPANRRIYGLQWRPDGQRLARCGVIRDGESEVVLIDPQTFETVTEIPAPVRALFALQPSWSGDGKRLALPSQRSTSLWDAVAEKLTLDVLSEDNGTQSAVFHPTNPDLLLQSGRSGMGILWDLRTKKVATRLQGHTHAISQAAWRPGSDQIATASWDGSVRLWNGKSGKLLTTVHGHERHVFALAWTPDGDRLVSAGNDHLIKCWRPEHPGHIRRFDCGPGLIDCQLNSDSSILSAAYTPGDLRIYDFADGGLKTVFENGPNQIWTTKLSTDSKRLVSAGAREIGPRGLVRIWNVDTGKQISEYDSPEVVRSLDWIEDKGLVILGLSHGGIQVLDEQLRPARPVIRTGLRSIDVLQLGPDDERLAFGGRGGMGLLHIASGKIKFWPGVTVAVEDLEWSRSGSKIAASTFEQHITVWDVETNSIAREFPNHFEPIYAIKWSPNDRRLLSVDARGTLVLWDANTGQPTLKKRTGFGRVRIALWSADGKIIVTNDSKSIVVLDASRGFQVESATKN